MTETIPETARLTADVVLFGGDDSDPRVLLIKRGWNPYKDHWALPGGHVDQGEDTQAAAVRELAEETGITTGQIGVLTLVEAYAAPGRDPRGRYVTFAYVAATEELPQPAAGDDAAEARWVPVSEVLAGEWPLAFDHGQIIRDAAELALP
jgi:8-oxo-dGTP diphosphatase